MNDNTVEKNGIRVSKSKSVYSNCEGLSFNELHTIASRLNKLAYDDGLDVTLKLEGVEDDEG